MTYAQAAVRSPQAAAWSPLAAGRLAIVALLATGSVAHAQVLTVGDTLGKGKNGVLLSDNVVYPGEGIPSLNIAYAMYARGLSKRFDLYLSAGETTTEHARQGWVGGGGNLHVLSAGRTSVSLFNVASVPLNRRSEASDVFLNTAVVASAPAGPRVMVYTGVNSLIPIGHRARGIVTPPETRINIPAGATVSLGPWGLWAEADIGSLHAFGVGLTRVF